VLVLSGGGYALVQSLVVPALPTLQLRLHTSQTGVAWVFTAFLLTAAVATPLAGRLGDMYGRRVVLLWTLAALSAGTLLAALTSSLAVLIAARGIQGLGGAIFPLAFGIIRDELDAGSVARGTAWMSAILGAGGVLGIVVAGPILDNLSYHWLFWLPLMVAGASTAAAYWVVPRRPAAHAGGVNWLSAALLTGWLVCLLLGVSEGPAWGWASPRVGGLFAAALVLALAWLASEARARIPLVDLRMLRGRGIWTTNVTAVLLGWGLYSGFVLVPLQTQAPVSAGGFGATVTTAGLYLLPWTGAVAIASAASGRLSARFGSRLPLIIGSALSTAGFAWLLGQHDHPWQIVVASAALGAGTGFAFASMVNLVIENVGSGQTGVATGVNILMRTVGGVIGTQVAVSVLAATLTAGGAQSHRGFTIAFAINTVMLGLATVVALAAPRARQGEARQAARQAIPAQCTD
jgi:MFS family permease